MNPVECVIQRFAAIGITLDHIILSYGKRYREIFVLTYGVGPYTCHHCENEVSWLELHVHHKDHNHSNNDPSNLVAMHPSCHMSHHSRNRTTSQLQRERSSQRHKGVPKSQEQREKIAEGLRKAWASGKHDSTRDVLIANSMMRRTCPACGLNSNIAGIKRHLGAKRNKACVDEILKNEQNFPPKMRGQG